MCDHLRGDDRAKASHKESFGSPINPYPLSNHCIVNKEAYIRDSGYSRWPIKGQTGGRAEAVDL